MLLVNKLFESVTIVSLDVGHTHWKVDAIFGVIAQKIYNKITGIRSLKDLLDIIKGYTK